MGIEPFTSFQMLISYLTIGMAGKPIPETIPIAYLNLDANLQRQ